LNKSKGVPGFGNLEQFPIKLISNRGTKNQSSGEEGTKSVIGELGGDYLGRDRRRRKGH